MIEDILGQYRVEIARVENQETGTKGLSVWIYNEGQSGECTFELPNDLSESPVALQDVMLRTYIKTALIEAATILMKNKEDFKIKD